MSKCKSDLLDNIYLAAPCPVTWDSMQGDDRIRTCNGCAKNVFNLSAMTRDDANSFLRESGMNECMIFFRRADGTIITDNCPQGLRKMRDKWRRTIGLASAFFATLLGNFPIFAQNTDNAEHAKRQSPHATQTDSNFPSNPAGGIRYIPPADRNPLPVQLQTVNTQTPITTPQSTPQPKPPTTEPINTKPKPGISPVPKSPPLVKKPLTPSSIKPSTPTKPQARTAKSAQEFFLKGQAAEKNKENKLAEFFYEKSLDFFDDQPNGDRQFRALIDSSLKRVRSQLGVNTN